MDETMAWSADAPWEHEAVPLPYPGECLYCFVEAMVDDFDCDGTLRFARRFRDHAAPRATRLEERLAGSAGTCDCEVIGSAETRVTGLSDDGVVVPLFGRGFNADRCAYAYPDDPVLDPACHGVRRGSTQPCGRWSQWSAYW